MGAHSKQYGSIVLLFLLISCFLWNCGDPKKEPKASIISKKISAPKADPSEKKNVSVQTETTTSGTTDLPDEVAAESERVYDPRKRIDPFAPLFKAKKKDVETDSAEKTPKKKRIPKTPLEKIGLDQLALVATIRAPSGNKGLVEDSSGKGYIIKNGTYIGLNSGIVTQISADRVIVEEEIENLMGKRVLQNTEIKLQKPAGE